MSKDVISNPGPWFDRLTTNANRPIKYGKQAHRTETLHSVT